MKSENQVESNVTNEKADESMTSHLFKRLGVSNKATHLNPPEGFENMKKLAESRQESFRMCSSDDEQNNSSTEGDPTVVGQIYDGAKWLSHWEEKDDFTIDDHESHKLIIDRQHEDEDCEGREEICLIYAPAECLNPQQKYAIENDDLQSNNIVNKDSISVPVKEQGTDMVTDGAPEREVEETKSMVENP